MKRQINLYETRLHPRFEWATARNLSLAVALLGMILTVLVVSLQYELRRKSSALVALQDEVQLAQAQLTALNKQVSQTVPASLTGELQQARALLDTRQEIIAALSNNVVGNHSGFSDYMFSFARQASTDVWLTGFTLSAGGDELELRGRMLNPAKLPDYVQRLGNEPLLRGRRFAALDIRDAASVQLASQEKKKQESVDGSAMPGLPKTVTSSPPPRFVEFVLRSENAGDNENNAPTLPVRQP